MLRLVHISDIHFDNNEKSNELIKCLIKDLIQINEIKKIDIILITGDLINKGGINFTSVYDGLKSFEKHFIVQIENKLGINRDRIFFTPGNHDIDRKKDEIYVEVGLKEYFKSLEQIENFMDKNTDCSSNAPGINRINDYKKFENEFYKCVDIEKCITRFESNYIINIDGHKIGISALNTAWRCYEKTDENLLLGEKQILNSQRFIKDCELKLALMHHSYELLEEIERRNIQTKITECYDYLFLGHVHNPKVFENINLDGKFFTSIAQSNSIENISSENPIYISGYSIFDIEKDVVTFYNRRYSYIRNEYVNNIDLLGDKGYKKFDLADKDIIKKKSTYKSIVERLSDKIEELNEDLLIYKTDSKAPKNLKDIFIEPILQYADNYEDENNNDKKTLNIQDILNNKDDILILGMKESGKTILVDKLMLELIEKNYTYKTIPIKLKFSDIKDIKKDIKNYLGVSNKELEDCIKNNITLFIENIEYSEENIKILKQLNKLKNNYSNIKLVLTMRCQSEGNTPIDIINNDFLSNFQRIYINNWDSKNIELLVQKWFSDEDINPNIEDIINMFSSVKITASPLNISMLLWIIEHQSDYLAINNAKLLETFFDYLLRKLDPSEICSSKFDYLNKIRLLSEIAYFIYNDKKYPDYRVNEFQLDDFVNEYLKKRKFPLRYKSVIDLFKERGILLYEKINTEITVRFRFECFFRYFIMQNMINKDEFRKMVISTEKYLQFEDEIDYFTGIKRDQETLLIELNSRMMKVYKKYIEIMQKQKFSFDSLLETSEAITNKVEHKDKSKLTNIKKISQQTNEILLNETLEKTNQQAIECKSMKNPKKSSNNETKDLNELFIIWNIVAKVLKNTEDIENGELKNKVYRNVLQCSIVFCIINKLLMEKCIDGKKYKEFNEKDKELFVTSRCIVFTHQLLFKEVLASQKLEIVIKEEIDKMFKCNNTQISEAELYISIFLLLDINKNLGLDEVQKFIRFHRRNYIKDMLYLKLSWCYKTNMCNDLLDKKYLSLIGEVLDKRQSFEQRKQKGDILNKIKHNKMIQKRMC